MSLKKQKFIYRGRERCFQTADGSRRRIITGSVSVTWFRNRARTLELLSINFRHLNRFMVEKGCRYEILKALRNLTQMGDFYCSNDLMDGYHAVAVDPDDQKFFTFDLSPPSPGPWSATLRSSISSQFWLGPFSIHLHESYARFWCRLFARLRYPITSQRLEICCSDIYKI